MTMPYHSNYDGTIPFSDTCAQFHLTNNVTVLWTIPGSSLVTYQARFSFSSTSHVFVRRGAQPALPAANSMTAVPYSHFKPDLLVVHGGEILEFISPDANAYFGASLMVLQE